MPDQKPIHTQPPLRATTVRSEAGVHFIVEGNADGSMKVALVGVDSDGKSVRLKIGAEGMTIGETRIVELLETLVGRFDNLQQQLEQITGLTVEQE